MNSWGCWLSLILNTCFAAWYSFVLRGLGLFAPPNNILGCFAPSSLLLHHRACNVWPQFHADKMLFWWVVMQPSHYSKCSELRRICNEIVFMHSGYKATTGDQRETLGQTLCRAVKQCHSGPWALLNNIDKIWILSLAYLSWCKMLSGMKCVIWGHFIAVRQRW